jgi:hypothetical protein
MRKPVITKLCPICNFPFDQSIDYDGFLATNPREHCSRKCDERAVRGRKPQEKTKRRCKFCNKLFRPWLDYEGKPTIHYRFYCKEECRARARSAALTRKYKKKIGRIS